MEKARASEFLIRFDDVCPTMNWGLWTEIEAILDAHCVKPMIAIVPNNKDPELQVSSPRSDFWEQVRRWKEKGWAIGVHGYEHLYTTDDPGILGLQDRSEFAGLPKSDQHTKLSLALQIFDRECIVPDIWVAPSHSFDWTTLSLLKQLGLGVVSDGLMAFPYRDFAGVFWVPQQLWRFRRTPPGVWTVCLHHNKWSQRQLSNFRNDVRTYSKQISNLAAVSLKYSDREETVSDRVGAAAMLTFIRACGYYDRAKLLLHLGRRFRYGRRTAPILKSR
jgi:predicted deacetylase